MLLIKSLIKPSVSHFTSYNPNQQDVNYMPSAWEPQTTCALPARDHSGTTGNGAVFSIKG